MAADDETAGAAKPARAVVRAPVSIIVPLLNERALLPELLPHLAELRSQGCEVLVVDGGSDDGSPEQIRAQGFPVLCSERGRARQMNAGAHAASGRILLFLHADTRLPAQARRCVEAALTAGAAVWGRYDVRISGRSQLLKLVAQMMNWRSRLTGIATGDQAIFVAREVFFAVGGFPDQPLMEDIALSRRLCARSRPACVRMRATTSGRRWSTRGVWRTILLMWWLRLAYWWGVSADRLAARYR